MKYGLWILPFLITGCLQFRMIGQAYDAKECFQNRPIDQVTLKRGESFLDHEALRKVEKGILRTVDCNKYSMVIPKIERLESLTCYEVELDDGKLLIPFGVSAYLDSKGKRKVLVTGTSRTPRSDKEKKDMIAFFESRLAFIEKHWVEATCLQKTGSATYIEE